jgi:hypothetical protein
MDTRALATQLIGEEPGFDVVLQTAFLHRQYYSFLYTTRIASGQLFFAEKNYLTEPTT